MHPDRPGRRRQGVANTACRFCGGGMQSRRRQNPDRRRRLQSRSFDLARHPPRQSKVFFCFFLSRLFRYRHPRRTQSDHPVRHGSPRDKVYLTLAVAFARIDIPCFRSPPGCWCWVNNRFFRPHLRARMWGPGERPVDAPIVRPFAECGWWWWPRSGFRNGIMEARSRGGA